MRVRVMFLPELRVPNSADAAIGLYKSRLQGALRPPLTASQLLLGYMAWPNNDVRRDGWVATNIARSNLGQQSGQPADPPLFESFGGLSSVAHVALDGLADEMATIQQKWPPVGDILMRILDMWKDDRVTLRGGPSISKAIALNEYEQPGRSHAQSYRLWKQFRDVAHLIAAGAFLAGSIPEDNEAARSIFSAVWYAPDSVLAIAAGFEQFGLDLTPHGRTGSVLPPNMTWRVPPCCRPDRPFVVKRQLSDIQVNFLNERRAPKAHLSKPRRDSSQLK
jgi:hypothetical protein